MGRVPLRGLAVEPRIIGWLHSSSACSVALAARFVCCRIRGSAGDIAVYSSHLRVWGHLSSFGKAGALVNRRVISIHTLDQHD
jgi:hypothetical protein